MPHIDGMNALVAVCRNRGKIEAFPGSLVEAAEAAKQSNRWVHDADGFTACADCTETQDKAE